MKNIIVTNPQYPSIAALADKLVRDGIPENAENIYSGRNQVYRLNWQGTEVCIKSFKLPGAVNSLVYHNIRKSKAARSYQYAQRLLEMGFHTPTPLAYIEECEGALLKNSFYVCEYITGEDVRNWERLDDCDLMLEAMAKEMVKLHRAGVWHKDFSPGNVIFQRVEDNGYKFFLIDINRMNFNVFSDKKLMRNFSCIHLEEKETERLARFYAKASGRDEAEVVEIALSQLHHYKVKKRNLKRLKKIFKNKAQSVSVDDSAKNHPAAGKANVAVIVPVYKPELTENERIALDSITKTLSARDIVMVCPESLDTAQLLKEYPSVKVERFDDSMFAGIRGYNRLMTSPALYQRFAEYEYILVAQLDTFIFADQLDAWCAKGYDYVGAPWLERPLNKIWPVKWLKIWKDYGRASKGDYSRTALYDKVGNGGLSLRKTESFLAATKAYADELVTLNAFGKKGFPEDVFWATRVENFSYPTAQEALQFAFDKYPRYSYKLNGHALPMGCHAWYSRKMRRFWLPKIRKIHQSL